MTITVGHDQTGTRRELTAGGQTVAYYSISAAEEAGLGRFSALPAVLKVLLENMLRFEDAAGEPGFPFETAALADLTLDALPSLLADVPEGTVMNVQVSEVGTPEIVGLIRVQIFGLGLSVASGTVTIRSGDCTTSFSIRPTPALALLGTYPTAVVDTTISSKNGLVQGTVSMNGTPRAVLVMTYNQESTFTWWLDLDTGELTTPPI